MIALGCDHGGYELKGLVMEHLKEKNIEFKDLGTYSTDSCDYPDIAKKVGVCVASGECERGILICGTGIGISIAANKIKGIRAACCSEPYSARLARLHNNANIICFGGRVIGYGLAFDIVDSFLSSEFEGGRHQRRINLISEMEKIEEDI